MSKAMLIDTTRCIGCRACQVACKSWHNLPGERTTFSETWSNPRYMNSNNYTRIIFREVAQPEGKLNWYFIKRQCMHCQDPACESVCPVGALTKLKSGPVVYDDDRCIGCRYCMMACPFQVPKFEWGSAVPLIRKCDFCADRIEIGLAPSCATACPSQALVFGEPGGAPEGSAPPHRGPPGKVLPRGVRRKDRGGHGQDLPHAGVF